MIRRKSPGMSVKPFANTLESSKGQNIQLHKGLLKRLKVWFMDPFSHINRSRKQTRDYLGKICAQDESPLHMWQTRDAFLRTWWPQKHSLLGVEEAERVWNEGGYQTPTILPAENRLIKLLSCKHVLPSKKQEAWFRGRDPEPRGCSQEPQRIFLPKPWNLMEFAWLDFKIAWHQQLLLSFHVLPFEPERL